MAFDSAFMVTVLTSIVSALGSSSLTAASDDFAYKTDSLLVMFDKHLLDFTFGANEDENDVVCYREASGVPQYLVTRRMHGQSRTNGFRAASQIPAENPTPTSHRILNEATNCDRIYLAIKHRIFATHVEIPTLFNSYLASASIFQRRAFYNADKPIKASLGIFI